MNVSSKTPPVVRSKRPWLLGLILFLFTLLTLYNSVTLPLGEAPDETDHYQYHRFVARSGHPPLTPAEREDAGFKGGLAPLYYWLTAWPVALVGENAAPDVRRVDARPERHIPTDGLGFNHVLHTLDESWPWQGQILAWHLVRLLSLPMAWLTLIAIYALARCLFPQQTMIALLAVAFVALLPRFVISSAVINDDNLVFALIALLLLVQVMILQGDHRPRLLAALGALLGLALVTKYLSLILLPEILFTLMIFGIAARKIGQKQRLTALLAFALALLLTAGPWLGFILLRFNRVAELGLIPGLAASLGEPQITEGLVGLLSGQAVRPPAATYTFGEWIGLLYRSFWFEYGWMNIFAPAWVYGFYGLFTALALWGLTRKIRIYTLRNTLYALRSNPIAVLLALHLALFVVVVLARYILSATIDTGQGRHLYPALPVLALLVGLGLIKLPSLRRMKAYIPILSGYALLSILTLIPTVFILPHYTTIPVTVHAPTAPAIAPLTVTNDVALVDLRLASRNVAAGDALAVTLTWQSEREVNQDFLVSLCLQDEQQRPAACYQGHFANGQYPSRAWEAGDVLLDTIYIPIPACYRINQQNYRLHLDLHLLQPNTPFPIPEGRPIFSHTFDVPITITPTDSLKNRPQSGQVWFENQRLADPINLQLNRALTYLTYPALDENPSPVFTHVEQSQWPPTSITDLHLPCDDGPTPFARAAHFIVDPTLNSGTYHAKTATVPPVRLSLRQRRLAPLTTTLTFSRTLAPLSLQLPSQPSLNFTASDQPPVSKTFILHPSSPVLPITLTWQTHRWMGDPLVISLKLLDKDYNIGGEYAATLGDRYPNVLWTPTEIVPETYPLPIKSNAPPGLYRLELSLIHQDQSLPDGFEYLPLLDGDTQLEPNLYPATVRRLDPAHGTPPAQSFSAQLGDSIQLTGYEITRPEPRTVNLALYWQNTASVGTDFTVFTQLLGPGGQVWAQWDNPPQAGRYPTTAWQQNDSVVDRYTLVLRSGAPPGEYRLLVGMYDSTIGERLPATIDGQPQPNNAIQLTTLSLNPK